MPYLYIESTHSLVTKRWKCQISKKQYAVCRQSSATSKTPRPHNYQCISCSLLLLHTGPCFHLPINLYDPLDMHTTMCSLCRRIKKNRGEEQDYVGSAVLYDGEGTYTQHFLACIHVHNYEVHLCRSQKCEGINKEEVSKGDSNHIPKD